MESQCFPAVVWIRSPDVFLDSFGQISQYTGNMSKLVFILASGRKVLQGTRILSSAARGITLNLVIFSYSRDLVFGRRREPSTLTETTRWARQFGK